MARAAAAEVVVSAVFVVRALFIVLVVAIASTACAKRTVSYAEARAVVNGRCVECHSAKPTSRAFPVAPKAVMFDTAAEMQQYAQRIKATVADGSMPLANMSGMTDEERRALERWVERGAKIP